MKLQIYIIPEFAQALEQCRQKGLHFTLAFQHLGQFKSEDERLYKAVKNCTRNKMVFAGVKDPVGVNWQESEASAYGRGRGWSRFLWHGRRVELHPGNEKQHEHQLRSHVNYSNGESFREDARSPASLHTVRGKFRQALTYGIGTDLGERQAVST